MYVEVEKKNGPIAMTYLIVKFDIDIGPSQFFCFTYMYIYMYIYGPIAMTHLILKFTNTMNMFLLQQLVRNIYCYNAQTEYFRTKFKFVHYQHQQPFLS